MSSDKDGAHVGKRAAQTAENDHAENDHVEMGICVYGNEAGVAHTGSRGACDKGMGQAQQAASGGGPHMVHEDEHGMVVVGQARKVCAHGRRAVRLEGHSALALHPGAQHRRGIAIVRLAGQVDHAHAAAVQPGLHYLRQA